MDKLTHAQFAQQCAYMAKECAAWSGDTLTLPEDAARPIDKTTVARFTDKMRERLDRIDEWAGRFALASQKKGDGRG